MHQPMDEMAFHGDFSPAQAGEIVIDFAKLMSKQIETKKLFDLSRGFRLNRGKETAEEMFKRVESYRTFIEAAHGFGFFSFSATVHHVVLHWPTIFKYGMLHTNSPQGKLVWLLQAVVRRRSPLLFSLLRRKFLTDSLDVQFGPAGPRFTDEKFTQALPLYVGEFELYESLVQKFVEMQVLGDLANRAFLSMFGTSGIEKESRYRKVKVWRDNVPKDNPFYWECSVVARRKLNELREALRANGKIEVPDANTDKYGFGASTWGKMMFDLLCIPHYATPDGKFGVTSLTLGPQKIKHMVVNLPLFIQQQIREDLFSKLHDVALQFKLNNKPDRELRDEVVKLFGIQFPLLLDSKYGGQAVTETSSMWPEASAGDIYAVPTSVFEHYRQSSRSMASMRGKQASKKRTFNKRPGFNQILQIRSPKIAESGGVTFTFRVIFRAKHVYVCPTWELDFEDSFLRERNYTTINGVETLRPGTLLNDATGEYYYMLPRYRDFKDTPLAMYSELSRWLHDFVGEMTSTDFKFVWNTAKRLPSVDVNVPRAGGKQPYSADKMFSAEADVIIERYLRPGKVGDVMVMLEKIGLNKTPEEITKRGTAIREQLIAEGTYDLDKLPHVNYSAILGKRLSKLRENRELGKGKDNGLQQPA